MTKAIITKGDVIGNLKDKYRFQVLEVLQIQDEFFKVAVQDMGTFETFEVTSDEMNFQDYKYAHLIFKK
jgi:aspartate carbamoyltransferase regulatory subunit